MAALTGGAWLATGAAKGLWITQACHASHRLSQLAPPTNHGTAKQKLAGLLALGLGIVEGGPRPH